MTKVRIRGGATVSERGTIRAIGTYVSTFDPALGLPTNGSGPGGMILKGDYWKASGAGTISGLSPFTVFASGDLIYAAINNALNASDFFGNKGTGSGGGGGGQVDSVTGGGDINVDNTDPANPVVSLTIQAGSGIDVDPVSQGVRQLNINTGFFGNAAFANVNDFDPAGSAASAITTSQAYADGKVADEINNGETTIAPSQNAVFDALAGKQNSLGYTAENQANKENTTLDTSTTKYPTNRLVKEYVDSQSGGSNAIVYAIALG